MPRSRPIGFACKVTNKKCPKETEVFEYQGGAEFVGSGWKRIRKGVNSPVSKSISSGYLHISFPFLFSPHSLFSFLVLDRQAATDHDRAHTPTTTPFSIMLPQQ